MEKYIPEDITVHRSDKTLEIRWQNTHISIYPLKGLRAACPCVVCRGGHALMGKELDVSVFFDSSFKEVEIKEITPTGSYGIQIMWSDGHNTGIYKWEKLRDACPCVECQPTFHQRTT